MKQKLIRLFATGFYTGELRPFPGTWGTLPGLILAIFAFDVPVEYQVVITLAVTAISVHLAGEAEKFLGHDAKPIVIDEVAGMLVTLVFVPRVWYLYGLGFLLFRAMDVFKLPPAKQLERLPSGWGITADDVMAGIYANLILQVVIYFIR